MGVKHLAFVEVMVQPSQGTIALNEEGSLSSEMSGAKVVVTGGPLTVEFDEAHLEEGRGRIESDEGWRSLSGGSEKGTISEVASRASWGSNEGFWPESYV